MFDFIRYVNYSNIPYLTSAIFEIFNLKNEYRKSAVHKKIWAWIKYKRLSKDIKNYILSDTQDSLYNIIYSLLDIQVIWNTFSDVGTGNAYIINRGELIYIVIKKQDFDIEVHAGPISNIEMNENIIVNIRYSDGNGTYQFNVDPENDFISSKDYIKPLIYANIRILIQRYIGAIVKTVWNRKDLDANEPKEIK